MSVMTDEKAIAIYRAYPRKVGRAAAIRAISKALKKFLITELICVV